MKKLVLSCAILAALWLVSCQKEEVLTDIPQSAYQKEASKNDLVIYNFAKTVSKLLSDKEIRKLIKTEAEKQFNGDYEILYMHLKDVKLSTGETFGERALKTSQGLLSAEDLAKIPLLSICVTLDYTSWASDTYTPSVVYKLSTFKENADKFVSGFDRTGAAIQLSALEEPKEPVIIIRLNERCNEDGTVKSDAFCQNPPTSLASRVQNGREQLVGYKIPCLSCIEGWVHLRPDIEYFVISNTNNANAHDWLEDYPRSQYNDSGWLYAGPGVPVTILQQWNTSVVGNYIAYVYVERDDDGEPYTIQEITNPGGGTLSLTLAEGDIYMGAKSVYFNDPSNYYYLSYIHFISRQQ